MPMKACSGISAMSPPPLLNGSSQDELFDHCSQILVSIASNDGVMQSFNQIRCSVPYTDVGYKIDSENFV